jgi:glycosyltransferase involved in cell wall biosynthesis
MTAPSLTLVLPAFNEADRLGPALDELFAFLDPHGSTGPDGSADHEALPDLIDVLVVDDGSIDGTADLVRARPEAAQGGGGKPAQLKVMTVPHGGKGAAVRAGMLVAQGDLVVFADADMATPPDMIPKIVAALADHDVAIGSRVQPDRSDMRHSQPRSRRLVGKAFRLVASLWLPGLVEDTQCGLKGFTRSTAQDLFALQRITSIVFDVELMYLARRRGYRLEVVPIRWADRRGSRLRARPRLAARVVWDLFRIPFMHRRLGAIRRTPTRVEQPEESTNG